MRTLSRADFFKLVVGSLGGGMLLSACGDDSDDSDDDGDDTNAGGNGGDDNNAGENTGGSDGGQTIQDAGAVAPDSGAVQMDAGMNPSLDSGMQVPDAGPPDAGMGKACSTGAKIGTISGTHKHTLMIPPADVTAAVGKTYTIAGGHNHQITLSTAQMQMVKAGMSVMVTSTEANMHTHFVQILCA